MASEFLKQKKEDRLRNEVYFICNLTPLADLCSLYPLGNANPPMSNDV